MKSTKKNQETRVYGRHACLKIFEKRPEDIVRAYITREGVFEFKALMKYLADHKLTYHVVEKEEIDAITKATHHENIALIVKNKKIPTLNELLETSGRSLILCLEEVENPHNLGAIMRSAAHFGVTAILYEAKVPVANSAAAIRTAEGGAETVPVLQVSDWSFVFDLAKRVGYESFATSSHEGLSLFESKFPDKVMLFLGAEREGLSTKLLKKIDHKLSIPGTGEVESLNVSNATTSILTEWYRQGQLPN
jgi:TrmH RNA methyltransferase